MAGMEFEFDEKGGTFYYFLLSFVALVVLPATYYLWPRSSRKDDEKLSQKQCHCEACQKKKQLVQSAEPWKNLRRFIIKVVLICGWIFLAYVAYKTTQVEIDYTEFDPFKELEIDRDSSTAEVKKAYRKLSLIYHPDRETGDPHRFMRISKAYKALTDEESMKNWQEYGNPDGPGVMQFGIALPKWIVEKQHSFLVLAVYALIFMVVLPVVVGSWWYKSIKYSSEQILLDTTRMYWYHLHKNPNMIIKRVLVVLGSSLEFERSHNSEIVLRESDAEEMPKLIKELPGIDDKSKEHPYSIKARALLHAHLERLPLRQDTLEMDKDLIVKKCPYLLNEMVTVVAQLVAMAHSRQISRMPRLETVENIMRVSQMIVQALWDKQSPLCQLPHISKDILRHFVTKKRNIRSIRQFMSLPASERRSLLRTLNDDDFRDVISVCNAMPYVEMDVKSEVLDDEDSNITAGSIVTVTVKLRRRDMSTLACDEDSGEVSVETTETKGVKREEAEDSDGDNKEEECEQDADEATHAGGTPVKKPAVWEKQKKKKGGKHAGRKKKPKPLLPVKKVVQTAAPGSASTATLPGTLAVTNSGKAELCRSESEETRSSPLVNGVLPKDTSRQRKDSQSSDEDSAAEDSEAEKEEAESRSIDQSPEGGASEGAAPDEGDDWLNFNEEMKKETLLEAKSKLTHLVHCPYFPSLKYEWWWLYTADRKQHLLITAPVQVTSLKDEEEITLKFSAPPKPGIYTYTVVLRSDSYFDFDVFQNIKLDVKEAKKVVSHPQWDISDEEGKDKEGSTESDGSTGDESED